MEKLYYSISEVSSLLGVNASTLRFWEKEFKWLNSHKNSRGVRLYTDDDIALLRRIIYLTHDCGYTLDGARDQIRQDRREAQTTIKEGHYDERQIMQESLIEVRDFLTSLKEEL